MFNSNIKDILNNVEYRAALNSAATLTCNRKVNITFVGEDSFTDGNNITIGVFEFLLRQTNKIIKTCLVACALHEAEHIVSTDFKFLDDKRNEYERNNNIEMYNFTFNIFNAIEDGRIENIHQKKFRNNIKYIQSLRKLWWFNSPIENKLDFIKRIRCALTDQLEEAKEELTDVEISNIIDSTVREKLIEKILNDMIFSICSIATCRKYPSMLMENYSTDEDMMNFINIFEEKTLTAVKPQKKTADVWNLSEEISEFLLKDFSSDLIKKFFGSGFAIKSTFGVDIIWEGADGEVNPGRGYGVGADVNKILSTDPITENLDIVKVDSEITKSINKLDSKGKSTRHKSSNRNYVKNLNDLKEYIPEQVPYTAIVEKLKKQIREILDLKLLKKQVGLKKGKINSKDLWKTSLGKKDVFYKDKENFKKNIAVHLLIDCSGSMCYASSYHNGSNHKVSNIHVANRTAAIVEESFSPYINIAITYFNHELFPIRKFDSSSEKSYVWGVQAEASGGTNDVDALEYAIETLVNRKEKKKFIMIISDGDTDAEAVRNVVNSAVRKKINVLALGLGVSQERFEEMYNYFIDCDSQILESQMINVLKKVLAH